MMEGEEGRWHVLCAVGGLVVSGVVDLDIVENLLNEPEGLRPCRQ